MSAVDDPFVASPGGAADHESHRYSSFDTQILSLDASSPAQAKRALEAHLAETEGRLEKASKLGTALVEQQRELSDKLKEVERQQDESQIGPELRRKLAELEKEYNDIGRETTRTFLAPKRHAGVSDETHVGTPSLEQKSPLNSAFFASQASNSPSKVSVPSRKQRNQPSSRVHDIEFATEISTSLLGQVRQLQALLAEREEGLKSVNLEKSRLELEAEAYAQRIRALDESEQRYKDENWALETQTHELVTAVKEAADRENRLNSNLSAITTEKSSVERESEDLKQINSKLLEDQAAAQKANDAEMHHLRRNLNAGDTEKAALQHKLDELTSQNQELAKAVAMGLRQHETEATRETPQDSESDAQDQATPENSPPPSPNKFTPRHNLLETETLRSSLGHAHRMIQNLKSTIHREKTEKIELKRMLQDARDEVEHRRRDSGPAASNKRQKTKPESFKKPPRPDLLGVGRTGFTEVELHDTDWEDNVGEASPTRPAASKLPRSSTAKSFDESSDAYHTATEAEDGFETATERGATTESDAFQTGAESMADDSTDSDELTETEDTIQRTPRGPMSSLSVAKAGDRTSFQNTASTSTSEDEDDDWGFPSPTQAQSARYRMKSRKSVLRKVRPSGEAPMASVSRPSSARNSPAASFGQESPGPEGQSLFAELAELEDPEGAEGDFGPSAQPDAASQTSTPRMLPTSDSRRPSEAMLDSFSKPLMVDFGVNTEPWEPTRPFTSYNVGDAAALSGSSTLKKPTTSDAGTATEAREAPEVVSSATQWTPLKSASGPNGEHLSNVPTPPKTMWDDHAEEERQENVVVPQLHISSVSSQDTRPVAPSWPELSMSYVVGGATEPIRTASPEPPELALSSVYAQYTEPMLAKLSDLDFGGRPELASSSVYSEHTEPVDARPRATSARPELASSGARPELASLVYSEHTEPVDAKRHETSARPELASLVYSEHTEPVDSKPRETSARPELASSSVYSEHTEPVDARPRETGHVVSRETPDMAVSTIYSEYSEPEPPQSEPKSGATVEQVVDKSQFPELAISFINSESTEPLSPQPSESPVPSQPELSFSTVHSVETYPAKCLPCGIGGATTSTSRGTSTPAFAIAEDSPNDDVVTSTASQKALPRHTRTLSEPTQAEQGAQTILSSKQIDQILVDRASSRPLSPPDSDKAKELGTSPFTTPRPRTRPTHQSSTTSLPSVHRRPGSAASQASNANSHPPLPADHREAIMAAEKRSMEQAQPSPSRMGPPLAPASAWRTNAAQRPLTPTEQATQAGSIRTNSRSKVRRESQASVSSFASELEERFNINPNAGPAPPGGTDPRMIQAITQTMIGEFHWKYTRKAVSGDMSTTRHRRYFWVHPYTRTLYWSEREPQNAGKSELRTKSVPIEAVRVVADDNPYPPGLHCRSLEVVTPGRRVRFTATTSQRHETWFNALSYLLLRNSGEHGEDQENNITLEDIDEFNPGFRSHSRQTGRMSVSSYNSRTRNWPKQRATSAMSVRTMGTPGRASPAFSRRSQGSNLQVPDGAGRRSSSRLSSILSTTIKGSLSSRTGRHASSQTGGHDESPRGADSADDLRQVIEKQEEEADRLENVRACCD
ncbi:hypothetical protein PHISP_07668, partial [Aspergillus sp. HF37]